MGLGNFFKRKTKTKPVSTLTPEQEALLKQLSGLAQQYTPEIYSTLAGFMRGETGLSPEALERFYQEGVRSPALYEFETYTKPQIEEQFGSTYHSSARTKALSRAFSDLQNQLAQTHANIQYQGLLQNLNARMQAAGMMQGLGQGVLGTKAKEIIATQQASPFDILTQGLGAAGLLMSGFGSMGLGGSAGAASAASSTSLLRR